MRYRRFVVIMIILTCLNALSSLAAPILISIWSQNSKEIGVNEILTILTVLIFTFIFNVILVYFRECFAVKFNAEKGKELFGDFFRMSYDDINSVGPTSIVEKIIIAVNNAYRYYTSDVISIWSNLFILLILLIMIFAKNIFIGILLLILIPINYFGYKWLNSELLGRSKEMQDKTSQGMQALISIAGQTDYLKQAANHDKVLRQIGILLRAMYKAMSDVNKFGQMLGQIFANINDIGRVLIMILVVYDYAAKGSNEINLIFFTVVLPIYFSGLTNIVGANLGKRDLIASNEFVNWMKDCKESNGNIDLKKLKLLNGKLEN